MKRWRAHAGVWQGIWSLILLCALTTSASGQEDTLDPISVGRVLLYPAVTLSLLQDDNRQRVNEDDPFNKEISTGITELQPGLRLEIPFEKSLFEMDYMAQVKKYSAEEMEDAEGTSHFLDLTARFQLRPGLRLDLSERLVKGISELQEVDPGGELRFGTTDFLTQQARVLLAIEPGGIHSFEVEGALLTTDFDQGAEDRFLFDVEQDELYVRYLLATMPGNQVFATFGRQDVSQERGDLDFQRPNYRTHSAGLGLRRDIGRDAGGEIRIDYTTMKLDDETSTASPYQGITVGATARRRIGSTGRLNLSFGRRPRPSFFNTNSYYVNEQVRFDYLQNMGQKFTLRLDMTYQRNRYPEEVRIQPGEERLDPSLGENRRDQVRYYSSAVEFKIMRGVSLNLEFRREAARSNILAEGPDEDYKIFDYDSDTYSAHLNFGWQ